MQVQFNLLKSGFCRHPEFVALRTGGLKSCTFPSLFGMIVHRTFGIILYDTGYSPRFIDESRKPPELLYRSLIPVTCHHNETAVAQLKQLGYSTEDVKCIVLSHFHADHIAGVRDFPSARFICSRAAYEPLVKMGRLSRVMNGFVKGLLPGDFQQRCTFIEDHSLLSLSPDLKPFEQGFDVLGDGSLIAIELPGHVRGQFGLFLTDNQSRSIFLIADSCWRSKSFRDLILPNALARVAISNWSQYRATLNNLHALYKRNSEILLIPSHCDEAELSLIRSTNG